MTKKAPPSRMAPQFVVRLPDEEFKQRIAEAAKANNRSMNAEIVARLNRSFSMPDLSGQTTSIDESGEIVSRDIVQHIADLQELLQKANWVASTLALFEGVREERERRDSERLGPDY
jgi:hypothetical protein